MKRLRFLPLLLPVILLFAGCDSNPAWVGPSPKEGDKAGNIAAEACKCMYDMAGQEKDWDRTKLMEAIKAIRKNAPNEFLTAVISSDDPDISKAIQAEEEWSIKLDDCDCMKPVQDGLLEQGVAFEEMMEILDKQCLLGAFYN